MEVDTETNQTESDPDRPKVSGVITSFNEEHNIADCIESLLWCDEIILVDSYYFGAGAQKNWAMILMRDVHRNCASRSSISSPPVLNIPLS